MSSTERLLEVAEALEEANISFLAMGGHAVRYYGFERNTADFDFCVSLGVAPDLSARLSRTRLFGGTGLREENTWRKDDFRRYQIGVLDDHKEEWLEFWFRNHLLDPFEELFARREEGWVLRRKLNFLSLADLIRSKETERDEDWQDVSRLEEFLDQRQLRAATDQPGRIRALSTLRSRRGFESALSAGYLADVHLVSSALESASHPITVAWLLPFASAPGRASVSGRLEPTIEAALFGVVPSSARHLALVEAARRAYQRAARAKDRRDKARLLRG